VRKLVLPFVILLICLSVNELSAQNKKLEFSSKLDLLTRHLWRGSHSGTAPTLEPTLSVKKSKFSFTAWGAYSLDESYQEVDLYVSYSTKHIEISLLDYYCPTSDFTDSKFFDYDSDLSPHMIDSSVKLKASKKFPVSILASVILYGRFDHDENEDQRYSTYLELAHNFKVEDKNLSASLGFTPFEGYYDDKANLVCASLYLHDSIKFSETYQLPVKCGLTLNPAKERVYLTFAFKLK
jgi:hypothetical protein